MLGVHKTTPFEFQIDPGERSFQMCTHTRWDGVIANLMQMTEAKNLIITTEEAFPIQFMMNTFA